MNAPERITGLLIAPGVVLLRPAARVDFAARRWAAGAIRRQLRRAKLLPAGGSGKDYLAKIRSRHGR